MYSVLGYQLDYSYPIIILASIVLLLGLVLIYVLYPKTIIITDDEAEIYAGKHTRSLALTLKSLLNNEE